MMGNNSQLKRENVLQVLQWVKAGDGGITKPELAASTGLTTTTIQNIITELEGRGVVLCEGVSASNGGRKALRYVLNRSYRYLVGVYLRTNRITIGVFDYNITLLHKTTLRANLSDRTVEETIRLIVEQVLNTLKDRRIPKELVAGIGINVPGPVDYESGRVTTLRGYPGWKFIALKDAILRMTGIPTFVDKDVYSGILLLRWNRAPGKTQNMFYLSVEDGIGAALMIGGKVYRGNHGVAGEIGHITLEGNPRRCACGNVGCLETVASDFALIDRARQQGLYPAGQDVGIEDLIALAVSGNADMRAIFTEAADHLAIVLRNLFVLYDPDEIVLNCRWLQAQQSLFYRLTDSLYDDNNLIDRRGAAIRLIDIPDFGLRSAGAIVAVHEVESMDSSVFAPP